ncbi:acetate CoA-transferase subunit alpha [Moorella sulfitireducens (nom. illeg.)]|uniref:acetate CoA-transferase subunit alpha n=1 Tax=Neomoorella sulfitireducens TaxID=2972948 RepID=UPI0021AC1EB6
MNKIANKQEFISRIKNNSVVMIGGFMGVGSPDYLIECILETEIKDLIIISNDTCFVNKGVGKLVGNKRVKKVIASHIGTNPETGRQMNAGEIEVELIPQGTLAERIRCAGAGLGGVLTPTGIGTVVESNKNKITINGKSYLLELPLYADIALIKAAKADTYGNLVYRRAARNFNPIMAMAAKLVIAEVEEIVEVGDLDPDEVMTPGIFVDMIVPAKSLC